MKTKNKKLFALLMLPVVIAMMVLPLCSFTTTTNSNAATYMAKLQPTVGYNYYRSTGTTYYGSIPNYNKILYDDNTSSVQFWGCDYLMVGTKSIDLHTFTQSDLPSSVYLDSDGNPILSLWSSSDDTSVSVFDGKLRFDGLINSDDIVSSFSFRKAISSDSLLYGDDMFYIIYKIYGGSLVVSSVDSSGNPIDYDFESFLLDHYVTSGIYDGLATIFDLKTIVDYALSYANFSASKDYYITSIQLDILYNDDEEGFKGYSAVNVTDKLYDNLADDYIYLIDEIGDFMYSLGVESGSAVSYQLGYEAGYNSGYSVGENKGLSSAPGVWSSLSTFLTNTVGSFFSFELWDGFSLGGVMAIIVGSMLFIAFLKVFAGG